MTSFQNPRVWFITGSSQGLGRALLQAVLAANERAVATLRKPEVLASLHAQYPEQLLVVPLDVTNKTQVTEAFAAAKERFGRLDVVVNNAGYGLAGEVEGLPEDEMRKQVEVLFWAPVNICIEAVKFMRDVNPPGQGGRIFNISSVGGYSGNPIMAFYNAGKFALEGFTEAFRKEMLPSWNIHVMIIEPGAFTTAWVGDSMVRYPAPPQYDHPDAPGNVYRAMRDNHKFTGNPDRAALALINLANTNGAELPLRIQFGSDALGLVRNKAKKTISDGEKWSELSHSTNHDGVDKDSILDRLDAANY